MWDRAPGPLPAESEMEEGGEEEGSERKGAAAARTGQVRLGFRLARRRPGRPRFPCQFLLSTEKKTGTPRFSPTLLFTEPP